MYSKNKIFGQLKKSFTVSLIAVLGVVFVGCDSRVGEKPPEPEVREYSGSRCLSEAIPVFNKFFSGKASDNEVGNSWECLSSAVSQIRRYVRGKEGDRIAPAEFATFLEDNFLQTDPGRKITPALQSEVMKLKQVFVGGSRDYITLTELDALARFLKEIKAIALQVNPSMVIFSMNWQPAGSFANADNIAQFEKANLEIQRAAKKFAGLIQRDNSSYVISDAVSLTRELALLTRSTTRADQSLEKYIPVIKKIKKTVSGGSEDLIAANEWNNFLMLGARGYIQFLRYTYFVKDTKDPQGKMQLDFAARTAADSLSILRDLVTDKPGQVITRAEVEELLGSVSQAWPTFKTSATLVDEVMKIKQALLGGSLDALTAADFSSASAKIETIHHAVERILPYYDVYAQAWASKYDDVSKTYLAEAQKALIISLREFGSLFEGNYDLQNLEKLGREVITLYPSVVKDPGSTLKAIPNYVSLVIQAKNFLFSDKDSVIKVSQWMGFFGTAARVYGNYLHYHYFFSSDEAKDAPLAIRIEELARGMFGLADEILTSRPSQTISAEELHLFLEKVASAVPEFKVSRRLVDEFMALKPLFFGGAATEFTKQDLALAQGKFEALRGIVVRLTPYWDVYTSKWNANGTSSQKSREYFTEATTALQAGLKEFSTLLESSYNLNRITSLTTELLRLYPTLVDKPQELISSLQKYVPAAIEVKNVLFSEKDSILRQARWEPVLRLAGNSFATYLQYNYFAKDKDFKKPAGLYELQLLTDRGFEVLQDILQIKTSHAFTVAEMRTLLSSVGRLGILPKAMDSQSLGSLGDVLVRRVLVSPDQRIAGRAPRVFNSQSVQIAQFELNTWMQLERFTASLYPKGDESYSPSKLRALYNQKYAEAGLPAALNSGLKEILLVLDTPSPLILDSEGRLTIADRGGAYRRENMATLNIYRMIARTFNRSYVTSLSRLKDYSGFTLPEIQTAFAELKSFAIKLKIIEASDTGFAAARFRDANMFTARADGNGITSFQEMTDLIAMLMSGVEINKGFKNALVSTCAGGASQNSTLVDKDCLKDVYRRRMPTHMRTMPYFASYIQSAPDDIWNDFFENVLKASGYVPRGQNLVRLGDVAQLPHVVQYIEMLFTKFDQNRDWMIDVNEALQAFPLFRGLIKEVAKGQVGDDELDDVFTFILKHGKPPETASEKLRYAMTWRNKPQNWSLEADRTQLARILGYIADQAAKPSTPAE